MPFLFLTIIVYTAHWF